MLKFIKNLFSRKKTENSQPIETIDSAIKKNSKSSLLLGPEEIKKVVSDKIKSQKITSSYELNKSYQTPSSVGEIRSIHSTNSQANSNSDFLTSMMIANATDSALMGTLIGGDPIGAMVGDLMNDSESHSSYSNDSYSNDSYSIDSHSNDSFDSDSFSSDSFSSDSFSSDF